MLTNYFLGDDMSKYSLGKQKTLSELCEKKDGRIRDLERGLKDQLNDCINFDRSKLTDCIMQQSSRILKGGKYLG